MLVPTVGQPSPGDFTIAGWELLETDGGFEWWCSPGDVVFRRRRSDHNYIGPDGVPAGVRREGSLTWWRRFRGLVVTVERC